MDYPEMDDPETFIYTETRFMVRRVYTIGNRLVADVTPVAVTLQGYATGGPVRYGALRYAVPVDRQDLWLAAGRWARKHPRADAKWGISAAIDAEHERRLAGGR